MKTAQIRVTKISKSVAIAIDCLTRFSMSQFQADGPKWQVGLFDEIAAQDPVGSDYGAMIRWVNFLRDHTMVASVHVQNEGKGWFPTEINWWPKPANPNRGDTPTSYTLTENERGIYKSH